MPRTTNESGPRTKNSFCTQYKVRPYKLGYRHIKTILESGGAARPEVQTVLSTYFKGGSTPYVFYHPEIYGHENTACLLVGQPYPSALDGEEGRRCLERIRDLGVDVLILPTERSTYGHGTLRIQVASLDYWPRAARAGIWNENPRVAALALDQVKDHFPNQAHWIHLQADRVTVSLPPFPSGTPRNLDLHFSGETYFQFGGPPGPLRQQLDSYDLSTLRKLDGGSHFFTGDSPVTGADARQRIAAAVAARDVIIDYSAPQVLAQAE
jgi:hypothetical protein